MTSKIYEPKNGDTKTSGRSKMTEHSASAFSLVVFMFLLLKSRLSLCQVSFFSIQVLHFTHSQKNLTHFQLIDVSWTVNKEAFIAKNGEWILANINCIGYYRVNYNPENWERLLAQLQKNRHVSTGPLQFYTFYWVIFTGNITTSYLLKLLCSIPGNKCRDFVSYWLIIKIKSNYIYINWQGYIEEK